MWITAKAHCYPGIFPPSLSLMLWRNDFLIPWHQNALAQSDHSAMMSLYLCLLLPRFHGSSSQIPQINIGTLMPGHFTTLLQRYFGAKKARRKYPLLPWRQTTFRHMRVGFLLHRHKEASDHCNIGATARVCLCTLLPRCYGTLAYWAVGTWPPIYLAPIAYWSIGFYVSWYLYFLVHWNIAPYRHWLQTANLQKSICTSAMLTKDILRQLAEHILAPRYIATNKSKRQTAYSPLRIWPKQHG